jgi:hypothetical protein
MVSTYKAHWSSSRPKRTDIPSTVLSCPSPTALPKAAYGTSQAPPCGPGQHNGIAPLTHKSTIGSPSTQTHPGLASRQRHNNPSNRIHTMTHTSPSALVNGLPSLLRRFGFGVTGTFSPAPIWYPSPRSTPPPTYQLPQPLLPRPPPTALPAHTPLMSRSQWHCWGSFRWLLSCTALIRLVSHLEHLLGSNTSLHMVEKMMMMMMNTSL